MGRNERQRNVIAAAMNEAASFSSITKVGEILTILGDNVQTDLDMKKSKHYLQTTLVLEETSLQWKLTDLVRLLAVFGIISFLTKSSAE